MSVKPPDDETRRPPVSSLDVPLDDSGADEVERKRSQRKSQNDLPVAAVEALKLKALGFSIMPLPTNQKAPPPTDWVAAAKNNPAVFLNNPGTHNYAILPPPGCFGWDVDKDAPNILRQVGDSLGEHLPDTLMTFTPNGRHQFYRWPADLPRPRGPMFGSVVTRWPAGDEGQGYLVGPGSVVVQESGALGVYTLLVTDDDEPIADLPRAWAQAALAYTAPRRVTAGPLVEVTGGPKYTLPESVPSGARYDAIVRYTAHLYNRGLSSNEMWPLVQAELAPRFSEAVSLTELRDRFERAVRDIAERLGEPKALPDTQFSSALPAAPVRVGAAGSEHSAPSQAPAEDALPPHLRAVPLAEFMAELEGRDPIEYLVPGWVPGHALTVVSGHPKSMKSLAVLQMLGAFVAGGEWLGTQVSTSGVNVGIYLTREGSTAEMLKRAERLSSLYGPVVSSRLRFVYEQPVEFTPAQYLRVSEMLADIESEMSVLPGPLRVILVLDPLRDLMPMDGDENEAKTMAVVKRWCRSLISDFGFLSIVLVHHLRKSAVGSTGLEMSGSGALYGAVDNPIIWKAKKEDAPDESASLVWVGEMYGTYRTEPRGDEPVNGRWRWDAQSETIVEGIGRVETASGRAVPGTAVAGVVEVLRGLGLRGGTTKAIAELVGVSEDNVRKQLHRLNDKGLAVREGGLWFTPGGAPFQQPDVILPVSPPDDTLAQADDEDWVDPLHQL